MSTLSEFFIEKAKNELGEDESRKKQALERIREWKEKHPYLNIPDKNELYMTALLRAKKYNLERTFKAMEKIAIFKMNNPKLNDFSDENVKRVIKIIENGFILVPKERDSDGRKNIYIRLRSFDTDKNNTDDFVRLLLLLVALKVFDEEIQIAGVNLIMDMSEVSFIKIEFFFICVFIKISDMLKYNPLQIKSINIFGLTSFCTMYMNLTKHFMSEKLRNRVNYHESLNDLTKIFDKSLLDKITENEDETIKELKDSLLNNIEMIRKFTSYSIDVEKYKMSHDSDTNIGNFRMLAID